jgi:hypothetical protein
MIGGLFAWRVTAVYGKALLAAGAAVLAFAVVWTLFPSLGRWLRPPPSKVFDIDAVERAEKHDATKWGRLAKWYGRERALLFGSFLVAVGVGTTMWTVSVGHVEYVFAAAMVALGGVAILLLERYTARYDPPRQPGQAEKGASAELVAVSGAPHRRHRWPGQKHWLE